MSITRDNTPEAMWGDAATKARVYADLSRRYASDGNAFAAVHAAWASDIANVQAVMWERIMVASPAPDEQFFAIARTVAKALAGYAHSAQPVGSAQTCVEGARAGLAAAFDPTAGRLLAERFMALDHLAHLPSPQAADVIASAHARVGDGDAMMLSAQRKQVAADSMAVAMGMYREGRDDDAMNQAWQSDWAAFEAYLLDAAVMIEDRALVTVDLRWALACDAIQQVPALPSAFVEAVNVIRDRLVAAAGPIEGARLREYFAPVE